MEHSNLCMWFIVVFTLIDNNNASLLFSQTLFSYCFCMLSEFSKVFERKVWRVQAAHLHNAARALSSPSRCFNCQQILAKNSFVIFNIVVKKQIECGLAWHWWNSADLGSVNWHMFNQSECRNCCLYNQATSEIWKYFQIWFFPQFWGENGGVLSMRMQGILDSLFVRPGSAAIGGGKKGEFRDWTRRLHDQRRLLDIPTLHSFSVVWN